MSAILPRIPTIVLRGCPGYTSRRSSGSLVRVVSPILVSSSRWTPTARCDIAINWPLTTAGRPNVVNADNYHDEQVCGIVKRVNEPIAPDGAGRCREPSVMLTSLGAGVYRWRRAILFAATVFLVFAGVWGTGVFAKMSGTASLTDP